MAQVWQKPWTCINIYIYNILQGGTSQEVDFGDFGSLRTWTGPCSSWSLGQVRCHFRAATDRRVFPWQKNVFRRALEGSKFPFSFLLVPSKTIALVSSAFNVDILFGLNGCKHTLHYVLVPQGLQQTTARHPFRSIVQKGQPFFALCF